MPKLSSVLRAVGKTINLARPQIYQVPKKPPLNTLIFEKLPEPRCGDRVVTGIKGTPTPKPIRVCTKDELKAMYCPPPPCDCKVKPPPLTLLQRLRESFLTSLLFKLGVKAFVVGSLINYTWYEGLWSDAFHSSCFLGKFVEKCPPEEEEKEPEDEEAPFLTSYEAEPCAPFIPRTNELLHKLGICWNKTIYMIFWIVLEGPEAFWDLLFGPVPPKPIPKIECPLN